MNLWKCYKLTGLHYAILHALLKEGTYKELFFLCVCAEILFVQKIVGFHECILLRFECFLVCMLLFRE
jgi:hypothetical protein